MEEEEEEEEVEKVVVLVSSSRNTCAIALVEGVFLRKPIIVEVVVVKAPQRRRPRQHF